MHKVEIDKLQTYLQKLFCNTAITVKKIAQKKDSVEVHINNEFIGMIYVDDEDGDRSYNFQMAILDFDLE